MVKNEELNKFIIDVFTYYNSRINVFNRPATLYVDWLYKPDSNLCGLNLNPNKVIIYPMLIMHKAEQMDWKMLLLQTIIHELTHVDQDIDYVRLANDVLYKQQIESACEIETYSYIAINSLDICHRFNLNYYLPVETYRELINDYFEMGYPYKRLTYISHISNIIREMNMTNNDVDLLDTFISALLRPEIDVKIHFFHEGVEFYLKQNQCLMSVQQLNDLFTQYYFKYTWRGTRMVSWFEENTFVLQIHTYCKNMMYRLSQKGAAMTP